MSIPDHIKRVSPFLLLGRYINKYHSALSPEPFEDKATKVDPTKLKGQIDSETLKLRGVVAVDPEMDPLRKVLGIEKGTFPDTEILQMLCYILFGHDNPPPQY
jgi:hypothetical protein